MLRRMSAVVGQKNNPVSAIHISLKTAKAMQEIREQTA